MFTLESLYYLTTGVSIFYPSTFSLNRKWSESRALIRTAYYEITYLYAALIFTSWRRKHHRIKFVMENKWKR